MKSEPIRNAVSRAKDIAKVTAAAPDLKLVRTDPWEMPIPLDELGKPTPFPLEFFPKPLAKYVKSIATSIGESCPVDYPAVYAVAFVAGAMGARYRIEVKPGWAMFGTLYSMIVAESGTGKSVAFEHLLQPFVQVDEQRAKNSEGPFRVSDATTEGLEKHLNADPRGIAYMCDEMSHWYLSMNAYRKGGDNPDRKWYLSAWSQKPFQTARSTQAGRRADRLALTICGGIQPEVLRDLPKAHSDGLIQRFLFSFPPLPRAVPINRNSPDEKLGRQWTEAIKKILLLKMPDKAEPCRVVSEEGWIELEALSQWGVELANGPYDFLRAVLQRLTENAARLALISNVIREAFGESDLSGKIGGEDVRRGATLAKYHWDHFLRVMGMMEADPRLPMARKIIRWAHRRAQKKEMIFSVRDCGKGLHCTQRFELLKGLKLLEEFHHIRKFEKPATHVGRPPTDTYELNPASLPRPL